VDGPLIAGRGVERLRERVDLDAGDVRAEAREHAQVARRAEAEVDHALAGEPVLAEPEDLQRARVRHRRAEAIDVVELLVHGPGVEGAALGLAEARGLRVGEVVGLGRVVPEPARRLRGQVRGRGEELLRQGGLHQRREGGGLLADLGDGGAHGWGGGSRRRRRDDRRRDDRRRGAGEERSAGHAEEGSATEGGHGPRG